ncbi:MAG: hypothetical protein AAGA18_02435 [Verrucomicrobiota bacterium]
MYKVSLHLLALWSWSNFVFAQIETSLIAQRQTFIQYEEAKFIVKVRNISNESLLLTNNSSRKTSWLSFRVKSVNHNTTIIKNRELAVGALRIPPSQSKEVEINISPYYAIHETGQYTIQAVVELPGRGAYITDPLVFNVGKGSVMWSAKRLDEGTEKHYSLIRFLERDRAYLYIRVEEPKVNVVHATKRLGTIVSYTDPQIAFDPDLTLHVLHTVGATTYRYTMIDVDGAILYQEDRMITRTVPKMAKTPQGLVRLVGGGKVGGEEDVELLSSGQRITGLNQDDEDIPMALPVN